MTATPTVTSDSSLSVTVPAGAAAGPVSVSVTTAGGTTNGLSYTYIENPTVTTAGPASGPAFGGTAVTITGTNLGTTDSVTFDRTPAPVLGDQHHHAVGGHTARHRRSRRRGRHRPHRIRHGGRRLPLRRRPRHLTHPSASVAGRR